MDDAKGGSADAAEDVDDEGDKVRLSMELVSGCVLPTELCRIMGGDDDDVDDDAAAALSPSGDPGGDMPKIPTHTHTHYSVPPSMTSCNQPTPIVYLSTFMMLLSSIDSIQFCLFLDSNNTLD